MPVKRLHHVRVLIPLIAMLCVATLATPLGVAPVSSPPTFTSSLVSPRESTGEPSIILDSHVSPTVAYYTAPSVGVWRSPDAGATWVPVAQTVETAGDASIAVDADGVVYLSGLLTGGTTSTVPVQVSTDSGATFGRLTNLHPSSTGIDCDRQWTAARGHGEAVTSVRCGGIGYIYRTTNAGVSWSGPFTINSNLLQMGPLTYAPDGRLYAAFYDGNLGLSIARSGDGGITWASHTVTSTYDPVGFPVIAVDAANTVYVAFDSASTLLGTGLEPLKSSVFVAKSANQGTTWSAPIQVSAVGVTGIFPWISAGAAGHVDVAWYSMNFVANPFNLAPPDLGTPTTTWDVVVAQSLAANTSSPGYARTVAVTNFHAGSICTSGLLCAGPQNLGFGNAPTPFDRRVLDFFEMRTDPATGNVLIAYPKDRALTGGYVGDLILSWVDLRVAVQTGGTTL